MPTMEEIKAYRAEIKNKTSEELQSLLDERERYAEWKRAKQSSLNIYNKSA